MRAALVAIALSSGACACSPSDAREQGAPHVPAGGAQGTAATALPAPPPPSSDVAAATSASAAGAAADPSAAARAPAKLVPWAERLAPLLFRDVNTLADVPVRLYRDDGTIDDGAASELSRVLWAAKDEEVPLVSRRLMQLVVKAAAHFDAHEVQVISSHRGKARKGSRHRTGEAIDLVFPGVPAKKLAEHLRTFARVGVGLYIHPRSQFVHLDVREQSYHWVDGSPPGRSWREHALPDPTAATRDAAYDPAQDLPAEAP
jgi:uncharacterized protein YcbK (DUF882 family)